MVQIFDSEKPQNRLSEMLGLELGKGLSNGVNSYYANKAIDQVLNDKSGAQQDISAKMGKLQSALAPYGEMGQKLFQQRMQIEEQGYNETQQRKKQEEEEVLGKYLSGTELTPQDYKKLSAPTSLKLKEFDLKKQDQEKNKVAGRSVKDALLKAGYPDETAELWESQIVNAPQGGQSDVIKHVNDLLRRKPTGKGTGQQEEQEVTKPTIEIPGIDMQPLELIFPEIPESIGLTPSDTVKQNEHREKVNSPLYSETVDRLNALDEEYQDVKYLQELNDIPGALPSGIEKWNVDWESGDLRVKALATPEAEAYVKTIARMARKAKEFFPGRVTNFDLFQFKEGFPTLANSPEGRKLIAQQLALGNRIAYLKDETMKAAIEHYGSGADPILIKKYATENYRRLKGSLENELKAVNQNANQIVNSEKKQKVPLDKAKTIDEIFPL